MPTYVSLLRWTQQGVTQIKESPSRLEAFKQALRSVGGELKSFYMVTGQYDLVVAYEAPSDEVTAKLLLAVAAKGGARTETMRAFTEDEYRRIIASLP